MLEAVGPVFDDPCEMSATLAAAEDGRDEQPHGCGSFGIGFGMPCFDGRFADRIMRPATRYRDHPQIGADMTLIIESHGSLFNKTHKIRLFPIAI